MVEVMNQYSYENQQINQLLEQLRSEKITGILNVSSKRDRDDRVFSYFLVWKEGEIVYANSRLASAGEIIKKLVNQLNPKMANAALKFVQPKITNRKSIREYLQLLVKVKALQWQKIEQAIQTQVASILEQLALYSGTAYLNTNNINDFDLSFGNDEHALNWTSLQSELRQRQEKWHTLEPQVPSLQAIPRSQKDSFETITKNSIRDHITKYIDGKRSLMDIAYHLNQDSLTIASAYRRWVTSDWITFTDNNSANALVEEVKASEENQKNQPSQPVSKASFDYPNGLPTVLSVDDSLIVQASIKRVLKNEYNLIFSDNAVDALKILNTKKVDLLLLDVTMPDIDGLQMCKTLRSISKFKDLPIIMVTARDTLVDKMKGQIAGTNHYLTKPFTNDQLKAIINKYIHVTSHSAISA